MNQLQFANHWIRFSVDQQEVMAKNVLCLNETLQKFWNLESIGMKPTENSPSTNLSKAMVLKR